MFVSDVLYEFLDEYSYLPHVDDSRSADGDEVVGWEIRAPSSVGCEFRLRDRHGVSRAVSGSSENRRPLLHGIGRIIRHGGRWLVPSEHA
jgi:hypothetical protein